MINDSGHEQKLKEIGLRSVDVHRFTSFSFPPKQVYEKTWQIATSADDKTVRIWNTATNALIKTLWHDAAVEFVEFSGDGRKLASLTTQHVVSIWHVAETMQNAHTPSQIFENAQSVAFIPPSGRFLAWISAARLTIYVGDLENNGVVRHTFAAPDFGQRQGVFEKLAVAQNGKYLASICYDTESPQKQVVVCDVETGNMVTLLDSTGEHLTQIAFSPDGDRLAASAYGITLWNVESGEIVRRFRENERIDTLGFSPNGQYLAYSSCNRFWRIVNIEKGTIVHQLNITGCEFAFAPNGKYFASAFKFSKAVVAHALTSDARHDADWSNAENMRLLEISDDGSLTSLSFTPDSRKLVFFKKNDMLRLVSPVDLQSMIDKAVPLIQLDVPPYVILEILDADTAEQQRVKFKPQSPFRRFLEHESDFYHFDKISTIVAQKKRFDNVMRARERPSKKR